MSNVAVLERPARATSKVNLDALRSIRIVLVIVKVPADQTEPPAPARTRIGALELCDYSNRAFWKGRRLELTRSEFKILRFLATAKRDCSHQQIYEQVRGPGFAVGEGGEGYRMCSRTFIKRIREKFEAVDPKFSAIVTYQGFGYRWKEPDAH